MAKKQDRDDRDDEVLDTDEGNGGGSRVYELGFHIDPELPSEEVKKAYQAIKEVTEKQGALVAEGEPEQVQLAYTISRQETSGRRDFNSAYFAWVAYETSAENHAKVLEVAKEDTRLIRFIDVITTKDAARHATEMRLIAASTLSAKEPEQKSEAAASAELDAALESATT